MKGDDLGGLINGPFHISFDRSMDCFIFIEKQGQNLVVIHLNRIPGLNNAPFVTFVPVEINVIMGG
jgi:hypothetical protein